MADLHTWTNSEWVWEEDRFCARTARLASKWLELNYEQDGFLLWVDMFDPHEPWDPPEYMVRWFDSSDYDGDAEDPWGPASASRRVRRGGSWSDDPRNLRSADRNWDDPGGRSASIGFRLARSE